MAKRPKAPHEKLGVKLVQLARALFYRVETLFRGYHGYQRFVIVCRARTGSNWLVSMMRHHGAFYAYGERFSRLRGKDTDAILAHMFRRHPSYTRAVGFKIFYRHPFDDPDKRVWERLAAMPDLRVIHLERRDVLRAYVSREIARQSKHWAWHPGQERPPVEERRIRVDPTEFRKYSDEHETLCRERMAQLAAQPRLEVFYEDMDDDPDREFARICEFLGLPFVSPRSTLRKQNPEPLSDLVENHEEIEALYRQMQATSERPGQRDQERRHHQ